MTHEASAEMGVLLTHEIENAEARLLDLYMAAADADPIEGRFLCYLLSLAVEQSRLLRVPLGRARRSEA